ncbi:hypothetical protein [Paraflavitalea speifideaquila]|uniref:hypothetical protein n=1 Tax=Paraflavitalea speifideaquila TaxID=3076558 RepID=UPI0028E6A40C|nr:hypothetical protein [Paraflavitalea speifideiaquila]
MSATGTWDSTKSTIDLRHQATPPAQVPYNSLLGGLVIGRIKSYNQQAQPSLEKVYKYSAFPDSTRYDTKRVCFENDYYTLNEERKFLYCVVDHFQGYECTGLGRGLFITLNSSIVNSVSVTGASPYYFKDVIEYTIDRSNKKMDIPCIVSNLPTSWVSVSSRFLYTVSDCRAFS